MKDIHLEKEMEGCSTTPYPRPLKHVKRNNARTPTDAKSVAVKVQVTSSLIASWEYLTTRLLLTTSVTS